MMKKTKWPVVLLFVMSAFLAACETVPPDAPPRPPPKAEMSPVLPSWSTMTWVMGYWKWGGTEWVWIPGYLAPKP
ncbi:CDI system lipoprotein BcpO [Burkholderia pseudomallei]|uniref:CDI system lipoprotein BcpO n=1 Tax=Burkholderia pseudomallei TaxID=28450 RepID=UPI001FCB9703|nr:CDI system lipoprotein BcpO [Burkholderia pseudomallei]